MSTEKKVLTDEIMLPKKERLLVKLVKEIAGENGLECETLSSDWIIILRDPKSGVINYIWGYSFGLNSQVASLLCNDKSALSDILAKAKIPHVEHRIFLNPTLLDYTPPSGVFKSILSYAAACKFDVVIKPTDGTGGVDVFHCRNQKDIETNVVKLFNKANSCVLCPYENIEYECRVVLLDFVPRLVFKKERPQVIGNGFDTVRQLILAYVAADPNRLDYLIRLDSNEKLLDFNQIPTDGEVIPILWKHNLGIGAKATLDINDDERQIVVNLAVIAAKTIGIRFASVDVIKTSSAFKVLEVNSGVMMEKAPTFLPNGEMIAKDIYSSAIKKMFEEAVSRKQTLNLEADNLCD